MDQKRSCRSLFGPAALACAAALVLFTPSAQAQQPTPVLSNNVPVAVSGGQAALVAPLPPTQQLYFSIALPLRNEAQLQDLLNQLYDPSSPNYHQYLTVPQFAKSFGPTVSDYNAVVKFAQANGFTVTGTPADRMSVPVQGTVAQIESAFHVKMHVYQHPTENRLFFSLDRQPSLNLGVPVKFISGLNNFSPPRPALGSGSGSVSSESSNGLTGSGPYNSYLPSDMRAAYYTTTAGATGLTGNLQCVSLVEFDGYNINDVTATLSADGAGPNAASSRTNGNGGYSGNTNYLLTYKTAGVTYPNIQINNVPVSGGSAATFDVGEEEVVLDIAQAIGMAPGLSQVRVYIAPQESTWTTSGPYLFPSNSDDLAVFEQMITDFNNQVGCNQASISWNWSPENPLTDPDNTEFEEFGAIGISFFSASGDYGSWDAVSGGVDECTYGNCYVYPQESPYLTAVGGTDLTTNGAGGSWASESGWSNSGGGISLDNFPIPSYQSGSAPGTYPINEIYSNDTSTSDRNAPDVAMEANGDNYWCHTDSPGSGQVCNPSPNCYYLGPPCFEGGTSYAAPRWAAFAALVNQQSNNNSQPPIGFINPFVYSIDESSNYLADFNEIEGGGNGEYSVLAGEYNMVTGWGSPKGQSLINALAPRVMLSAPDGYAVVWSGGPATTFPITVTVPNGYSDPDGVALKASSVPTGVTISIPPCLEGDVPPGSYNCQLTIDAPASANPVGGEYTVTVAGTNNNGVYSPTTFTLYVENPSISASPASLTLSPGNNGTATITSNMVSGPEPTNETLSYSSAPAGVTITFSPNPLSLPFYTSTMKVSVGSTTVPGNYAFPVTGTVANAVTYPSMQSENLTSTITITLTVP